MLGRNRQGLRQRSRGTPWRQGEESLWAPEAHGSERTLAGGKSMTKGVCSHQCSVCLAIQSIVCPGYCPPPLLLFSSKRAARRMTPPAGAAPTSEILPSAWPHAHHPRQNRTGLGGGCLCPKQGQLLGARYCMRTVTRSPPDSQGATRQPPEAFAKSTAPGPRMPP